MAFDGKTDREVYREMYRASAELVRRYDQYVDLTPSRPAELAAGKDKLGSIRNAERVFRGFYERCRDIRERSRRAQPTGRSTSVAATMRPTLDSGR